MRGDLHVHTRISDGSMPPPDVVDYAARIGLDCLAITDHDTMRGVQEAWARANTYGIRVLPGMEVSTFDYEHGKKVHLLCYCPKKPEPLLEFCKETLTSRNDASLRIIKKVAAKYPVDLKTVKKYAAGSTAICKQHIAMALTDMGYSLSVFGDLFWELFSSKSGWALVEPHYPETREALGVIKRAGGVAVLAHPGVYDNFDLIDELCSLGLDGIECFHPRQSAEAEQQALQQVQKHRLLKTGGSDFHGMYSTRVNPLATRSLQGKDLRAFLERVGQSL